ncbi:hypothetical protein [Thalassobaculum litoreum]|uniref:Uncharacterized protein n=1 Tax=Thalassobaculum litoreum DSM 18839 TaxID=1123362 RepID=A0A8G2F4B8_9PROT|nr:hypothetical protein [Thalassobaculum litoreum]SDG14325.1 hypothetical protein SAMN05660686_03482 [Thalassobaculum litoreum DSM 18839]
MSWSSANIFKDAAAKPRPNRRRASSISIRVSNAEREVLKRKAGKRSLGAYVREIALGEDQEPRRTAAKPSIDYALLAQLLGKLGKSDQVSCLFLLLTAAEGERIAMTENDREALHDACAGVHDMRAALMGALALRGEA